MRGISYWNGLTVVPEVQTRFLLAGGTAQAADLTTGSHVCRLTGVSTGGNWLTFFVQFGSTQAALSSAASTSSTGTMVPVVGELVIQVPSASTGYSVISGSSGYVSAEFWGKG